MIEKALRSVHACSTKMLKVRVLSESIRYGRFVRRRSLNAERHGPRHSLSHDTGTRSQHVEQKYVECSKLSQYDPQPRHDLSADLAHLPRSSGNVGRNDGGTDPSAIGAFQRSGKRSSI